MLPIMGWETTDLSLFKLGPFLEVRYLGCIVSLSSLVSEGGRQQVCEVSLIGRQAILCTLSMPLLFGTVAAVVAASRVQSTDLLPPLLLGLKVHPGHGTSLALLAR